MSGKQKTPDQAAQAVILREAGWTISAIAGQLEISISTAQRLLKKHGAVSGASTLALIERAREGMLDMAFSLENVQRKAASLILDDLALSEKIRTKLSSAIDVLDVSNPIVFRSLAASATALKLTQDITRRALPLDKLDQSLEREELPVLQIHIMNEHDVAEMRAHQRREDAEINGDSEGVDDAIETLSWLAERRLVQAQELDNDIVSEE
ncbi:hypothetical protein NLO83_09840 [Pseudomonas tremae]|uniref:helix-turn-helix domain-containing protein n=1 Tax=Pseudomonas syringae group TaxID=136849 RepID=UPI0001AF5031|nr:MULTISPECIES: helix-turn-helix domain-containing protein [Pseudomonas syringae group]MCQ3015902.1 hypothetical protein [Pseudomonas tremae]QGL55603.1 hypothetical protein POR16_04275 [Pseudomonas coronafaciens pv. oryzae str. 1_6]